MGIRNGAVLIVELDGLAAGLERQAQRVIEICKQNQAREVRVVEPEVLGGAVTSLARELKLGAPSVQALVKTLVSAVDALPHDSKTAAMLSKHVADQCITEEALEGMRAFLEKRKPRWAA